MKRLLVAVFTAIALLAVLSFAQAAEEKKIEVKKMEPPSVSEQVDSWSKKIDKMETSWKTNVDLGKEALESAKKHISEAKRLRDAKKDTEAEAELQKARHHAMRMHSLSGMGMAGGMEKQMKVIKIGAGEGGECEVECLGEGDCTPSMMKWHGNMDMGDMMMKEMDVDKNVKVKVFTSDSDSKEVDQILKDLKIELNDKDGSKKAKKVKILVTE